MAPLLQRATQRPQRVQSSEILRRLGMAAEAASASERGAVPLNQAAFVSISAGDPIPTDQALT